MRPEQTRLTLFISGTSPYGGKRYEPGMDYNEFKRLCAETPTFELEKYALLMDSMQSVGHLDKQREYLQQLLSDRGPAPSSGDNTPRVS